MNPEQAAKLNPALARARFCPVCGASGPRVDLPRRLSCDACGHVEFHNPKPVACAIPRDDEGRILLLKRGFAPGAGKWTFPGGFVDLGESVEDAALREGREELGVDLELGALLGVYSRPDDRIALIVFTARLPPSAEPTTTPEAIEIARVAPHEVPWDDLAFWSTAAALGDLLR